MLAYREVSKCNERTVMKLLRTKILLNRLIAFLFALSCFFPAQVVLALKDCGTHEVVSCEEHDDQHFVARHLEASNGKLEVEGGVSTRVKAPSSEEHDSAHQIEKSEQNLATITETSTGLEHFTPFVALALIHSFEGGVVTETLWPNAPPDPKNTFLSFLPSVRLQV